MIKDFKKLLMKKAEEGKFISDEEKEAKKLVLNEIGGLMKEKIAAKLKDIKNKPAEEKKSKEKEPELSKEDKIAELKKKLAKLEGIEDDSSEE